MTGTDPMLIWLNGAYGSGKTTIARRLVRSCPGAWLLDPERIGFALRRRREVGEDFRALPAWRAQTLAAALAAAEGGAERLAIVPMALAEPDWFDEIVGDLRRWGVRVHHFSLLATPETLRRRLRRRLDWPASRRWALARVECFEALRQPGFAVQIETDGRPVEAIVREIVGQLPADLAGRFRA
ncbi:MAG TPA: AAA family ATPase [Allosphingosinicella sp.]|nr:AAA family ATPase [Allosphingosinicella sp.]